MKKSPIKHLTAAALCIALTAASSVCVFADSYYSRADSVNGISFSSAESLTNYIKAYSGKTDSEINSDIFRLISKTTSIYCPKGFSSPINIIVTPSYIRTDFNNGGKVLNLTYYCDDSSGKSEYESAKNYAMNGTYSAKSSVCNKNTVYCYEIEHYNDHESVYVWKQGSSYFKLLSAGRISDDIVSLCSASAQSLGVSPPANTIKPAYPTGGSTVIKPYDPPIKWEVVNNGLTIKNGKLYYIKSNGTYARGWKTIGSNTYYFKKNGEAATSSTIIGGIRYSFADNGVCLGKYTGWSKSGKSYFYYKNGKKQTSSWLYYNNCYYYLKSNGARATGRVRINGKIYEFASDGVLLF